MPLASPTPLQDFAARDCIPPRPVYQGGENQPSAAGDWQGSYIADTRRQPRVFTAELHAVPFGKVNLYGAIGDGAIERLQPGSLIGSQFGALVRFSQAKRRGESPASGGDARLEFVGYISGDGTVMRGRWREACHASSASSGCVGSWIARRS